MANLISCLKPSIRKALLFFLIILVVILIACKPEEITAKENKTQDKECKARECGCIYICSYEEPKNCQPCDGEKLAQVCIAVDGKCENAEPEMVSCALSGGYWKTCGSGCGPVLLGQNLTEERICQQVCIEQCSCPSESPYWDEKCVNDVSKGPIVKIQKRSEAGSLKMTFRAIIYNYNSFKKDLYCAKAEWDFGDGNIETFKPVCREYSEDSEVQDIFQASHTFKERGLHKATLTLSKGEFAVSTDVDVVV